MEAVKKFLGSAAGRCIIAAAVLVAAFLVHSVLENRQEQKNITEKTVQKSQRAADYAEPVDDDHVLLKKFIQQFPDASVVLACEEDVTDDGVKDLVVIYKSGDLTRTVVVMDSGDGETIDFSEPIPAPIENQKIQFKNIDKEGEIEIIITGEKKGAVGYAIYRIIDGEPVDLFGEGMEDCC